MYASHLSQHRSPLAHFHFPAPFIGVDGLKRRFPKSKTLSQSLLNGMRKGRASVTLPVLSHGHKVNELLVMLFL